LYGRNKSKPLHVPGDRGGIEDVGFAKCKLGGMEVRRILVKKESEIRGLVAGVCDG